MTKRIDQLPFFRLVRVIALVFGLPLLLLTYIHSWQYDYSAISNRNKKLYDYLYDVGSASAIDDRKYPSYVRGDKFRSNAKEIIVFIGIKWGDPSSTTEAIFKLYDESGWVDEAKVRIVNGYNHVVFKPKTSYHHLSLFLRYRFQISMQFLA